MRAPRLRLCAVLFWAAAAWGQTAPGPRLPMNLLSDPSFRGVSKTRCELCHVPTGWLPATFPHQRTGFPLNGEHANVSCRSCHLSSYSAPLPRQCSACHRDAHRGDFGERCEGCHDETSWRPFFDALAHRRTNFPLVGRHALLPCTECHQELTQRRFVRTTVDCVACHRSDYYRASSLGINHPALGFPVQCRECHDGYRFQGAKFLEHEKCFPLAVGAHAGVECLACHSTLAGTTTNGTCNTGTAACSSCHDHLCSRMDAVHVGVTGYVCSDRQCYQCHPRGTR